MFTRMNCDRANPLALTWESWVSAPSFSAGLAGYLWFVCVLVMIAARGHCCSQTRSIIKAKVPFTFKLKNYNIVFK
jgi:hypothetical protein